MRGGSGVPRSGRRRIVVMLGAGVIVLTLVSVIVANRGDGNTTAPASASDSTASESDSFCQRAAELVGPERPESYVGSSEHLADIESLRAAAPDELQDSLATYSAFIASGAVDPAIPESNESDSWPTEVKQATEQLGAYIATNCS